MKPVCSFCMLNKEVERYPVPGGETYFCNVCSKLGGTFDGSNTTDVLRAVVLLYHALELEPPCEESDD